MKSFVSQQFIGICISISSSAKQSVDLVTRQVPSLMPASVFEESTLWQFLASLMALLLVKIMTYHPMTIYRFIFLKLLNISCLPRLLVQDPQHRIHAEGRDVIFDECLHAMRKSK